MELKKCIEERHSCRNYLPTEVTDEQINIIVNSARLSPSAKNIQPWKFVCIKTASESHDISNIMKNYYLQHKDLDDEEGAGTVYATGKILEDCPAIILVFEDSERIDRDKMYDISACLSIGSAVEHMMLTATDLGLGSLWIADTYFVHKELADYILNKLKSTKYENFINYENRLICAMAVGYPAEPKHPVPRKQLNEILAIIHN